MSNIRLCVRNGCYAENCGHHSVDYGYVCRDCISELTNLLVIDSCIIAINIRNFLDSRKVPKVLVVERPEDVAKVFKYDPQRVNGNKG